MKELIHIEPGLYRSCPIWRPLPTNTSCRVQIHIGMLHFGVPTHRLFYTELAPCRSQSTQGFLHISDLLLYIDLLLTCTSPSSLHCPRKRQQTPALSCRQVLTHQYLYLTVSSLVAEAGNLPSPRSRLQGSPSERRLLQSFFFREFSRPSL